jgi:uncharacterized protein (TIGR00251 family)
LKIKPFYQWQGDTLLLHVQTQPRASKDEIVGPQGENLKIRITAPPVDGKANQHLLKFLAKTFRVARSDIHLLKGDSSRIKSLSIKQPRQLPACIPEKN